MNRDDTTITTAIYVVLVVSLWLDAFIDNFSSESFWVTLASGSAAGVKRQQKQRITFGKRRCGVGHKLLAAQVGRIASTQLVSVDAVVGQLGELRRQILEDIPQGAATGRGSLDASPLPRNAIKLDLNLHRMLPIQHLI